MTGHTYQHNHTLPTPCPHTPTYLQVEHGRANLRDVKEELQERVGVAVGEEVLEPGEGRGVVPRKVEAVEPALGEVDVLLVCGFMAWIL